MTTEQKKLQATAQKLHQEACEARKKAHFAQEVFERTLSKVNLVSETDKFIGKMRKAAYSIEEITTAFAERAEMWDAAEND